MSRPFGYGDVRLELLSRRAGSPRTGQSPHLPVTTRRLKGFFFWSVAMEQGWDNLPNVHRERAKDATRATVGARCQSGVGR
jgi:hypothetical protein